MQLRILLLACLAGLVAADTTGTQLPGYDYTFASDITGAGGGSKGLRGAITSMHCARRPPTCRASTWLPPGDPHHHL
jgi:hypothetical protein